jgi:hypothetical protein
VAYPGVPPTVSGMAIGSLVAGIGSVLVSFVVGCFGVSGAKAGWGPVVAGAFAVLGGLIGLGAMVLGWLGLGQVRRSAGRITGRGMAISGIACGAAGFGLTVLAMVVSLLV